MAGFDARFLPQPRGGPIPGTGAVRWGSNALAKWWGYTGEHTIHGPPTLMGPWWFGWEDPLRHAGRGSRLLALWELC